MSATTHSGNAATPTSSPLDPAPDHETASEDSRPMLHGGQHASTHVSHTGRGSGAWPSLSILDPNPSGDGATHATLFHETADTLIRAWSQLTGRAAADTTAEQSQELR